MKRFHWPLQRLLDVTIQRERALRAEVFDLSRRIARAHGALFDRRAAVRGALAEIAALPSPRRLPVQETFMGGAEAEIRRIRRMEQELRELQQRRAEKLSALERARSKRQTLERLREEARRRHEQEVLKLEQKQLDESSQSAFVRRSGRAYVAGKA